MKPTDMGSTEPDQTWFGSRRGRWLTVFVVAAVLLVAGAAFYLRTPSGVRGEVQKLLRGARSEERRGTSILDSLIERMMPARPWQGEYFYQNELVKLGTNAVPELLHALENDTSPAARRVSVKALGELSAPGIAPVLIKALGKDQDQTVREAIVDTLGTAGDTNALPVLLTTLRTDPSERVRVPSASALGELGGPAIIPQLVSIGETETNTAVRTRLAETFGRTPDPRSLPLLVAWSRTPYPTVRQKNPASGNEMEEFLSSTVRALGNIGGEEAFGAITARWQVETDRGVRRRLCEAFGAMGDGRALPVLLLALKDDVELKSTVVEALGNLGDTNAAAELLPLLDDGDKEVRQKTADALARIGGVACVPELMRVAEEDNTTEVRRSACAALGMIGDARAQTAILHALPQLGSDNEQAIWALGHVADSNAIPALTDLLSDNEREARFAAAYALAEIGGAAAADAIAAHLEDKDEFARHGKACALAMLGRTNGLPVVRSGLQAKEEWRRFGAAIALIRLGPAADAKEWTPLLSDRVPALRVLASESASGRGTAALAALLRDSDKDLRHYAARGLVFFRDPATLPDLRKACRDSSPEVRNAARVAVRCIERAAEKSNDGSR